MRRRFEGPEKALVPYCIYFKEHIPAPSLVPFAQESAEEDRRTVLAAIGDNYVFGGLDAADEFLAGSFDEVICPVILEDRHIADCVIGCVIGHAESNAAMLAVPYPAQPSQYEPFLEALRELACYLPPNAQDLPGVERTLVWGHFEENEFRVDTILALIVLIQRPSRGVDLKAHFQALSPLGVVQCWLLHDKVYHIQW